MPSRPDKGWLEPLRGSDLSLAGIWAGLTRRSIQKIQEAGAPLRLLLAGWGFRLYDQTVADTGRVAIFAFRWQMWGFATITLDCDLRPSASPPPNLHSLAER